MPESSVTSLECASSPAEIKQLQRSLIYRRQLLEALLDETHRDLKILLNIEELTAENNPLMLFEDSELPPLINKLSQSFIDFIRTDVRQYETPEARQQACAQLQYQSSLLRNLIRQIELQIGTVAETLESMGIPIQEVSA